MTQKVRNRDQGETSAYDLHDDGTYNGDFGYKGNIEALPEATRPFMGAPVLTFDGKDYSTRRGANVWS